MKHLALLAVLLAATASAQVTGVRRAQETTTAASPTSRAAVTAADFTVTAGTVIGASIELQACTGFRVMVCAVGGNLSGAGNLRANLLDGSTLAKNPGLDLTVTVSGSPCQAFPDQATPASRLGGRVLYAADAVTHTGTGVIVYVTAAVGNL